LSSLHKIFTAAIVLGGAALLVVATVQLAPEADPVWKFQGRGGPAEATPPEALPSADTVAAESADAVSQSQNADGQRTEFVIGRDETFYESLQARGAPHEDIMDVVAACKEFRNLGKVRRGDRFWLVQHEDGGLAGLGFDLDEESWVEFRREGDGYTMQQGAYPVERRLTVVAGAITSSLYHSLQEAGASLQLAPKMNDVFGWEIDFNRDLRTGDTFRIVYEEVWKEGRFVRTGPVIAAECVNRGRTHRAYRFTDPSDRPGYFDAEGKNFQKQLMRAPLEYSRISSGFSYRRFHPILKRWMPHTGVDYAAPVGTPVWAAGDGVVVELGRKKGNGRYARIRHTNQEYESWYLHLSRYARGLKRGSKVQQGQTIGYVGATGYATGPHLDFRIKRNGRWVNPRGLKLPPAAPVAEGDRAEFAALTRRWNEALDAIPQECNPAPLWAIAETVPPHIDPTHTLATLRPPAALPDPPADH
jgi:murein DD-endopeptidase MepM/ murein hydrolase activator NlpD